MENAAMTKSAATANNCFDYYPCYRPEGVTVSFTLVMMFTV